MTSELRVDKIHNEGGDNDSGIDLSTNDVVAINTKQFITIGKATLKRILNLLP